MPPESCDRLVKHEQRAMTVAQTTYLRQETRLRRDGRLGFQYHTGNSIGMRYEQRLEAAGVVEAELDRKLADCIGNARRHFRRTDEPVISREKRLITADRDEITPCIASSQFEGGSCRIGA